MKTFYFETGVRRSVSSYSAPGDVWKPIGDGDEVRLIPFDCDNVPESATLKFLCNDPNIVEPNTIVQEVYNTTMLSKYAYFRVE